MLLALLGLEFALAGNVVESLVYVYIARALVEQGTAGVELGLHERQHVVNGREVDNGLAKLLAVAGVCQTFVVGSLRYAHALCRNAQAGTVHQCHHILDEAQLAVAAEFGLGIFVHQLAGGAAMNAELVFDAAHVHTAFVLVVNEH